MTSLQQESKTSTAKPKPEKSAMRTVIVYIVAILTLAFILFSLIPSSSTTGGRHHKKKNNNHRGGENAPSSSLSSSNNNENADGDIIESDTIISSNSQQQNNSFLLPTPNISFSTSTTSLEETEQDHNHFFLNKLKPLEPELMNQLDEYEDKNPYLEKQHQQVKFFHKMFSLRQKKPYSS